MRQIALCIAPLCFVFGMPVRSFSQATVPQQGMGAPNAKHSALPRKRPLTVTGILLVSDQRCDEWPAYLPKDKWECPEGVHQWGLITDQKQYAVQGITSELKQFERRRVRITGFATPVAGVVPIDNLEVQSIAASEVDEGQIRGFIDDLRSNNWSGPENLGNPMGWVFHPTAPMIQILQAGPAAQDEVLNSLNDLQIKDQIIFLLGGVGDARAVKPIIDAMADSDEAEVSEYARKVNLAANLALTNLTVADVNWHHGGGITVDRCPDDPKSCWSAWWAKYGKTFDITHTASRSYVNYPDYGIYQDPHGFRSENFRSEH